MGKFVAFWIFCDQKAKRGKSQNRGDTINPQKFEAKINPSNFYFGQHPVWVFSGPLIARLFFSIGTRSGILPTYSLRPKSSMPSPMPLNNLSTSSDRRFVYHYLRSVHPLPQNMVHLFCYSPLACASREALLCSGASQNQELSTASLLLSEFR